MLIIDDSNWQQFAGMGSGALPRRTAMGGVPQARVLADEPGVRIIPESEWISRITLMQNHFARHLYGSHQPKQHSQGRLPYCWAFSCAQCVEVIRAADNQPYVELAPESLGGDVNYRAVGNHIDSTLQYAAEHGIAAREYVPLHSLDPRRWKTGWQDNARRHIPSEWFDCGAKDVYAEGVTCLLSGLVLYVAYSWWQHAVMIDSLVVVNGEVCFSGPNSWGPGQRFVLKGSRKIPDWGCFALRAVTYRG